MQFPDIIVLYDVSLIRNRMLVQSNVQVLRAHNETKSTESLLTVLDRLSPERTVLIFK